MYTCNLLLCMLSSVVLNQRVHRHCVIQVCVLVQGGYLVQVRLNGYSNPTGKCGHSDNCYTSSGDQTYCCDSFDTDNCSGDEMCDSYFTYCLRPFGSVQLTPPRCSTDEYRGISTVNRDDRSLNFSQSTVLGLSNPQMLSGLEGPYNVCYFHNFSIY